MLDLHLHRKVVFDKELVKAPNLCDRFSSDDLKAIGAWVWDGYYRDKSSRYKWERRMEAALDLAMQVQKNKTFPWPGASNVIFPLITIAALQFSSKSYANIIQGTDVVRYRIVGDDKGGILKARADRVGRHMSWQILEGDDSWEEQHDRLLTNLAIVGSNFVKTYFDADRRCPTSELVTAQDLVMNYYSKSVNSAPRKTHRLPMDRNEIWEMCARGLFRDVRKEEWFEAAPLAVITGEMEPKKDNRMGVEPPQSDSTTPYRMLEQHVSMDLDNDGYAEPYIVTIEEQTHDVVRIVSRIDNWDTQVDFNGAGELLAIRPTEYFTKYGFIPSPDGGIYDLGFGIFLGPINEVVNSGINQLIDSGTMQTSIGGFLGRGAKIRSGVYTMAPWEWKRVDAPGDDLRKHIVPYPERQPSDVLFKLVGLLIEYSNKVAGTVDAMVGENPGQNTPAETFRGMQEQGMAFYGTIFKRVWRSLKEEFQKWYLVNQHSFKDQASFGSGNWIRAEDYSGDSQLIAPVADPNIPSSTMRIQQALAVQQMAERVPGFDLQETTRDALKALKVVDINRLYPGIGKVPPLPNPKMQVEQGKIMVAAQKVQLEKLKMQGELMEQHQLNLAKIMQLKAQAAQLLAQAGIDKADLRLRSMELALDALVAHNDILDRRAKALGEDNGNAAGQAEDGSGRPTGPGGNDRVEAPPSDAEGNGGAGGAEGGAEGAVGGEGVPGGNGTGNGGAERGGASAN